MTIQQCIYVQKIAKVGSFNEAAKQLFVAQHYDFIADIFGKMLKETESENYKFSLRETRTHEVILDVETARSDIGIIAIKDSDDNIMRRYLDKKGLSFTSFLKASPHVFLRDGHPLLKHDVLTYDILKDYPYVSYDQGERSTPFFTEEIMREVEVKRHIEIGDRATLMNVLLLTDCYTIGTGIMPSALNNGSIRSVPLESDAFYTIGYILRSDSKMPGPVCEFIDRLRSATEMVSCG